MDREILDNGRSLQCRGVDDRGCESHNLARSLTSKSISQSQMLAYRRSQRVSKRPPIERTHAAASSDAARASRNQCFGFQHLSSLGTAVRRSASTSSISTSNTSTLSIPETPHELTESEKAERLALESAQDRREVERELCCYRNDGVVVSDRPLDIVKFWDVRVL